MLQQVLEQSDGRMGKIAVKQWQQQRPPHLGQWVWTPPATRFGGFWLDAAVINQLGTDHRNARSRHILETAGSSFGYVRRNLLRGEGREERGIEMVKRMDRKAWAGQTERGRWR